MKWWYKDEVGWGDISHNHRTVQEAGWNFCSCYMLTTLIHPVILPTANWRCTSSQPAFGFHPINSEINLIQGEQRGNKGQLEALDVKKSLTSADSYVEKPGRIARWLTNKSASFFIVILSMENPLTGSSVIKAISKTRSNETKKGLTSLAYSLSRAMGIHEDSSYTAQWILWTAKKQIEKSGKKSTLIPIRKKGWCKI